MRSSQVGKWITPPRFAPYLAEVDGHHDAAVALYVWNARISAAAFETLHHVEVLLRNAVDAQFVPNDATASLSDTWLEDPALLNEDSRKRVRQTVNRIMREHKVPTRSRVVAGLSFGFWRALFDRKNSHLWASHLHRAFPAGTGDRAEVASLLSSLVPFRNRLAHHETIMRRPISGHHDEMLTLAALIDPAASAWIRSVSRVESLLLRRGREQVAPCGGRARRGK
jgi:hypothetical protein